MFERRLKLFLLLLGLVVFLILGRAAQVQIVNRQYWKQQAAEAMKRTDWVDSTRGAILDRSGKVLAIDKPCIDVCVDYRALTSPPDAQWVKERALERLKARLGDGWKQLSSRQKVEARDAEIAAINADIEQMWSRLAKVSGRSLDDIDEAREAIVHRVTMRRRFAWARRYEEALIKQGKTPETPDWKKMVADAGEEGEDIDKYSVTVSEQLEAHVILRAVAMSTQNALGREIEHYPGLVLRAGTHRTYPYEDVACHLLGHVARVDAQDLKDNNKGHDEVHDYLPNDLIGKTGVEALCEPALRGARGRIDRASTDDIILASAAPVPGQDVRLSIDIELQQQIQGAFASATLRDANGHVIEDGAVLHGACVVLDVNTNQVLALVSYPTYDQNTLDEMYATLRDDEMNDPLRNRATMSQLEPGSTVKPLCGLAGLAEHVIGVNTGIECTGYMKLDGHQINYGKCWVASMFAHDPRVPNVAHHPVPVPHEGHDGNPDGFLTYSDALERSCNVFFETVADRLGIERLSAWYDRFGLGRATGIGIGEARGRLPRNFPASLAALRRSTGFFGGIGQGYIAATPIQMANAVAMIARDGVWMRPVLVLNGPGGLAPALKGGDWQKVPDRVDLQLPADYFKAARLGMFNVVNGAAGTGKALVAGDKLLKALGLCGKTGTAQAARFSILLRDDNGKLVLDASNRPQRHIVAPSVSGHPNPDAPWYRATDDEGKHIDHAWYIGFAPADKPKIAFAVLVEYGGSGGIAAASVAREAVNACIGRGYLQATAEPGPGDEAEAR